MREVTVSNGVPRYGRRDGMSIFSLHFLYFFHLLSNVHRSREEEELLQVVHHVHDDARPRLLPAPVALLDTACLF